MSDKKELQESGLDTEDAKRRELDEQPKPTRKVSHPATPYQIRKNQAHMIKAKGKGQLNK